MMSEHAVTATCDASAGEEAFLAQRYDEAWALLAAEAGVTFPLECDVELDDSDDNAVERRVGGLDDEHDMAVLVRMGQKGAVSLDATPPVGDASREGAADVIGGAAGDGQWVEAPGTPARALMILSLLAYEGCGRKRSYEDAKRLLLLGIDLGSRLCRALYGCYLLDCKPNYAPPRRKGLPMALFEEGFGVLLAGGGVPSSTKRDEIKAVEPKEEMEGLAELIALGDPDGEPHKPRSKKKVMPAYHPLLPRDWLARIVWAYWSGVCDAVMTDPNESKGMALGREQREEVLRELSAQGIAFAQLLYGVLLGNADEDEDAVIEYQKAHAGGCVDATWELACNLESGVGVAKDSDRAFELFVEAGERGSVKSLCSVGWAHLEGIGVPKSDDEAWACYLEAAKLGDCKAQNNVGALHTQGRVNKKVNHDLAVMWFRRACEQRYSYSQYYLGWMYAEGNGVPKDVVMTTYLYYEAALQEHEAAHKWIKEHKDEVGRNLCLWKIRTLMEQGWQPHIHGVLRISRLSSTFTQLLLLHGMRSNDAPVLCVLPIEMIYSLFTFIAIQYLVAQLKTMKEER